jgi:DNA-binding transcriptional regulator YdaS (Cro superfamily)
MKLIAYMRVKKLDDEAMASRVGGVTRHAVKKWMYGERMPRPEQIAAIAKITGGKVTLSDWIEQAAERSAARKSAAAASSGIEARAV